MTTRRGFLGSILALSAAPAIVRADALMRVMPIDRLILWGDGIQDDTIALQALINGARVLRFDKAGFTRFSDGGIHLRNGHFLINQPLELTGSGNVIDSCVFISNGLNLTTGLVWTGGHRGDEYDYTVDV